MDDVTDLIERLADRGNPRGAQRVLDDARRGTVSLQRQSPPSPSDRNGRVAIALLAGAAVVVAAFFIGRSSQQSAPTTHSSGTVLDSVSDADAAQLCQAFGTLQAQANSSKQSLDARTTAATAEQYLQLAERAKQVGADAFAVALTESGTQLALQAQQNLEITNSDRTNPTTTISPAEFRIRVLSLRQSDTALELACAIRGNDPVLARLSNSDDDSAPTTAPR
jgi:hypothetical protein